MEPNMFPLLQTLLEHITRDELLDSEVLREVESLLEPHFRIPFRVELHTRWIFARKCNDASGLFLECLEICFHFFSSERLSRGKFVGRISDARGEIAYEKNDFVSQLLEAF